jgi:hypothetical protein
VKGRGQFGPGLRRVGGVRLQVGTAGLRFVQGSAGLGVYACKGGRPRSCFSVGGWGVGRYRSLSIPICSCLVAWLRGIDRCRFRFVVACGVASRLALFLVTAVVVRRRFWSSCFMFVVCFTVDFDGCVSLPLLFVVVSVSSCQWCVDLWSSLLLFLLLSVPLCASSPLPIVYCLLLSSISLVASSSIPILFIGVCVCD